LTAIDPGERFSHSGKKITSSLEGQLDFQGWIRKFYRVMVALDKDAQTKNVSDEAGFLCFGLGGLNLTFNGIQGPDHHILTINR
jgi:hypothetical protein